MSSVTHARSAPEMAAPVNHETQATAAQQAVAAAVSAMLRGAGGFAADVTDAYASLVSHFYAATAQRLGVGAQELFKDMPFRVHSERVHAAPTAAASTKLAGMPAATAAALGELRRARGRGTSAASGNKLASRLVLSDSTAGRVLHQQVQARGDGSVAGMLAGMTLANWSIHAQQMPLPTLIPGTVEDEIDAVSQRYKGTPLWMKAPNGEPTKLTTRQWLQVRTPSFKKWFGDWEKFAGVEGGVWSDGDGQVSKAVDRSTGEPMVVMHGTDKAGFAEFKRPGGTGRGDAGIFTTPDRNVARTYARKRRSRDVVDEDVIPPAGVKEDDFEDERDPFSGIYSLFLNIRNPHEVDFEGAHWDGSRNDQWAVMVGGEQQYDHAGRGYFTEEEALALAEEFLSPEEREEGADPGNYVKAAAEFHHSTDTAAAEARRFGCDGVIIHQVIDDGSGDGYGDPADVYVAFEPEQLKSADFNSGTFDPLDGRIYLQSAFHGSPHAGIERFSTDRIGTGEGAAVYGWGLYFTSKREIAEHYRKALGGLVLDHADDEVAQQVRLLTNFEDSAWATVTRLLIEDVTAMGVGAAVGGDLATRLAGKLREYTARYSGDRSTINRLADLIESGRITLRAGGALYEVSIPEDEQLLLWDARLEDQPERVRQQIPALTESALSVYRASLVEEHRKAMSVLTAASRQGDGSSATDKALQELLADPQAQALLDASPEPVINAEGIDSASAVLIDRAVHAMREILANKKGSGFYKELAGIHGSYRDASEVLAAAGIKGIRYLDGDSRAAGEGSYNYVIFSDQDVAMAQQREAAGEVPSAGLQAWFAKSQVVDAAGRPRVVFHGTRTGGFDTFKARTRKGEQLGFGIHFSADMEFAKLYAENDQVARRGATPQVYAVHVRAENLLDATAIVHEGTPEFALAKRLAGKRLFTTKDAEGRACAFMQSAIDATSPDRAERLIREAGYDGVRYMAKVGTQGVGARTLARSESWVVFSSNQIKSATDNNGRFDANSPNILHQSAWPGLVREPAPRSAAAVPAELTRLADLVRGKSFEAAKRAIVSQVGSVQRGEKFDDDVADAVLLRLQRVAQVGLNTDEADFAHRKPKRLDGEGMITLYRCAPKGAGIRPGDFAAASRQEAGFYKHGGNVVQSMTVPRRDVIAVEGSMGGGQEFVYLPADHQPVAPKVFFDSFRAFFDAATGSIDAAAASRPTDSKEFRDWFAGSKVVDAAGTPLVVYHGTLVEWDGHEFNIAGSNEGGAFFSPSPRVASTFANPDEFGLDVDADELAPHVMPVHLSIKNPKTLGPQDVLNDGSHSFVKMRAALLKAREEGYDGAHIVGGVSDAYEQADQWVAFDPSQIKSAIGNRGTFDPQSPDILHQSAFHGSPHAGIGRFSVDRIGTGEGAQAFGWGLYFASRREVAEHYRKTLTAYYGNVSIKINGRTRRAEAISYAVEKLAEDRASISREDLIQHFEQRIAEVEAGALGAGAGNAALKAALLKEQRAALKTLRDARSVEVIIDKPAGELYEVEIPEDDEMLHWDLPLHAQPAAVRAALGVPESDRLVVRKDGSSWSVVNERTSEVVSANWASEDGARRMATSHSQAWANQTGKTYYKAQAELLGSDRAASESLAAIGIKGIKYLDGDSRRAGEGSFNYVVFRDGDVALQQPAAKDTPEFKAWFAQSKIVDAAGRPQLMFHATTADFDQFEPNSRGVHFLSPSPTWASDFLRSSTEAQAGAPDGSTLMPVYVSAQNPFDYENKAHVSRLARAASLGRLAIDQIKTGAWARLEDRTLIQAIKKLGFDGLFVKENGVKNLAVFNPEQIKSALGNRGTFDPHSPSILHQTGVTALEPRETQNPVETQQFKSWFGRSKVVDEKGQPLVVFHGGQKLTAWNKPGDESQIYGGHADAVKREYGHMLSDAERFALDHPVHFFTDDESVAEGYADQGDHYEVRQSYLRMEAPLDLRLDVVGAEAVEKAMKRLLGDDFELESTRSTAFRQISQALRWNWSKYGVAIKEMGHDGVILYDTDVRDRGVMTSYAVFDPKQIKSAVGNRGTFDPQSANILHQAAWPGAAAAPSPDPRADEASAFSAWFGDSKVIDAAGKPLVVYHGTGGDFAVFDETAPAVHWQMPGFYFAPDAADASRFAEAAAKIGQNRIGKPFQPEGANVMPVYLSLQNPKVIEFGSKGSAGFLAPNEVADLIREAKFDGHDGVILKGWQDGSGDVQYVVFRPEQIKSAVGNRGTYSPQSPNILHQSAFHGSPKKGITTFSTDHIGTGDGVGAYGWGLYFAGEKEVAEFYRKTLSGADDGGQTYQVEIPDDDDLLLWDAKLDAQSPKVRQALEPLIERYKAWQRHILSAFAPAEIEREIALNLKTIDGQGLYEQAGYMEGGGDRSASEYLMTLGIKGIKYRDGLSRGRAAGDKTFNFVIFSGDDVQVLDQARERQQASRPAIAPPADPNDIRTEHLFTAEAKDVLDEFIGQQALRYATGGGDLPSEEGFVALMDYELEFFADHIVASVDGGRPAALARVKEYIFKGLLSFKVCRDFAAKDAFEDWFAGSQVVDAKGAPLLVYHGTAESFQAFDSSTGLYWFTDDQDAALSYGYPTYNRVDAYLAVQNPARDDDVLAAARTLNIHAVADGAEDGAEAAKVLEMAGVRGELVRRGFDGAIVSDTDTSGGNPITAYVAFSPEQIKSAKDNRGTYNPEDPSILNQSAYHGSPNVSIEQFSTRFIGEGEGAQAYGWGLYFAGRKEVAEWYQRKLTERQEVDLWTDELRAQLPPALSGAQWKELGELGAAMSKAGNLPAAEMARWRELRDLNVAYEDAVERLRPRGRLYEVEIPEDDELLLWDRSLSEQPEAVRKALAGTDYEIGPSEREIEARASAMIDDDAADWAGENDGDPVDFSNNADFDKYVKRAREEMGGIDSSMTGCQLYRMLMRDAGYRPQLFDDTDYQEDASNALLEIGIKGIKYLDGSSRKAGEGSYNYVIFSGDHVKVVEQNLERAEREDDVTKTDAKTVRVPPTQTQAFKAWFEGSQVTTDEGAPQVVYHGTYNDFDAFSKSWDIGFHFGTAQAANDRIHQERNKRWARAGAPRVIPVYLSIKNPVVLPDLGTWSAPRLARELVDVGAITHEQAEPVLRGTVPQDGVDGDPAGAFHRHLARVLLANGYDGIKYRNMNEGTTRGLKGRDLGKYLETVENPSATPCGRNLYLVRWIDNKQPVVGAFGSTADEAMEAAKKLLARRKVCLDYSYIALKPEQIKSALGNVGTFDAARTSLLHQVQAAPTPKPRPVTPPKAVVDDAPRGGIDLVTRTIALFKGADRSTFLHEAGHLFLEMHFQISERLLKRKARHAAEGRPALSEVGQEQILQDTQILLKWFGVQSLEAWHALDFEAKRVHHEQFARGFEAYLFEGKAPQPGLRGIFDRFRGWLVDVYQDIRYLNVHLTEEVRGVFDRMLAMPSSQLHGEDPVGEDPEAHEDQAQQHQRQRVRA